MSTTSRLTRSEDDRLIVGVCGGLAEHFGIDATIVRIAFVLLAVFGGSGIILYLALWLIVPRASQVEAAPRAVVGDGLDEARRLAQDGAEAAKRGYRRWRGDEGSTSTGPTQDAPPPTGTTDVPPPADTPRPSGGVPADPMEDIPPAAPPGEGPPTDPPGATPPR